MSGLARLLDRRLSINSGAQGQSSDVNGARAGPSTEDVYPSPPRQTQVTLGSFVAPSPLAASDGPGLFRARSVPSASSARRPSPFDDDDEEAEGAEDSHREEAGLGPGLEDLELRDGDALPAYSPRISSIQAANMPVNKHTFKSQKLKLDIDAPGEAHILLVEGSGGDGRTWISGEVTLNLTNPEVITHIKIRLRAMVCCLVMRVHGSGRHPVSEDLLLWEDAKTLWSNTTEPPEGNVSPDGTKLQGTFIFPFRLHLPSRVTVRTANRDGTLGLSKKLRLPPSFILTAEGAASGAKSDWASCRYFCKITLGRKGLLKANERIIVPIVFIPKPTDPGGSILRMAALASGNPIPTVYDDPAGWAGKKARQQVKRGLFSAKKAFYEVTLLLPTPAKFSRYSTIPYALKIISSDPDVTGKFAKDTITVQLVQRAYVSAQGLSGSHDTHVAQTTPEEDGPPDGEYMLGQDVERDDPDQAVWAIRYAGTLRLTQIVGQSFKVPNLVVNFVFSVHIAVPGAGNDIVISHPIEICAALPPPSPSQLATIQAQAPTPVPISSDEDAREALAAPSIGPQSPPDPRVGLPPSYFSDATPSRSANDSK